jgi:hypothetical protein
MVTFFTKPFSVRTKKKSLLIPTPIFQGEGNFNPLRRNFNPVVLAV